MGKKYKIKKSKKLIKKLKPYWMAYEKIEDDYYKKLSKLEEEMEMYLGIRGAEFFMLDGFVIGIGNVGRSMELIRREKLSDD